MISLEGKAALVTGGSRGIGRACCEMLALAGARVAINYRVERPAAEALGRQIQESGGTALVVEGDVSVPGEAEMIVDETVDRFGAMDILVNNAGIWKGAPIDEISDGEWSEMIGTNLSGTFNVVRCAVPHMKQTGGTIINVSSTAGQRGEAFHSHYAATKGAVISMTKSLATELAPHGITTNCVAPGWVSTDMTREALEGSDSDAILAAIPLGRVAEPNEIAAVVVFLASGLASFINGEVVNVNGGSVLVG